MTNEELSAISMNRFVDQITIVTDDVYGLISCLTKLFRLGPFTTRMICRKDFPDFSSAEFCYHEAVLPLSGGMEIKFVQPVFGDTIYQRFYNRFGKGIMGIRERVPDSLWDQTLDQIIRSGTEIAQECGEDQVWVDYTDVFGGFISLIRDSSPARVQSSGTAKICQICIVTNDVLKTAHDLSTLIKVGPWEIGNANTHTIPNMACAGYAEGTMGNAKFLIGISRYGNLEFELIQPISGPLPYFNFLNRRGIGFHHIKQQFPKEMLPEELKRLKKEGLKIALSGSIGPCSWYNWATEELLGFIYEMNDDTAMTQLPDGYDPYIVQ